MKRIRFFQVDAFTNQPFRGNPAAVCLLESAPDEDWMQTVAAEMNLSETAFVLPRDDGFDLRWFTPLIEVDLCGHATLASAHAIWSAGLIERSRPIRFHTRSGLLVCRGNRNGRPEDFVEMDFPATPVEPMAPPQELVRALGVEPSYVGQSMFDGFVVVESEPVVRALKPDFSRLREIPMRGVIVTSLSDDVRFDFVSRYFAPAAGIDEDPVTGSAHCCLGPFWSERLGRTELTGYQASSRGGVVSMSVSSDRVVLGGQAVTVLEGSLVAP
ncbi:MAG: PhzF family phenazine biosynthesis protein [Gammaproteobacteria bacterium]